MMSVETHDDGAASRIAAAIGEPARARMLYCLLDGHARTSTELAIVAEVSPSTASSHLQRLTTEGLIKVQVQGKHRYYSLFGRSVARVLESLSVLAGKVHSEFVPNTPLDLRAARTCYDHMAGTTAVLLHDRLIEMEWISETGADSYSVTSLGSKSLATLGIDVKQLQAQRRRFGYACLDWSERRPHIGGAIGAGLLSCMLTKKWVTQETHSRALSITNLGRRELLNRFNVPSNAT